MLPGMPDHRMNRSFVAGCIGDDTTACDGRYSVLLKPLREPNLSYKFWSNWEPGKTYTISFYAKVLNPEEPKLTNQAGTVGVDAVQLELGMEPTSYVRDSYQLPPK